MIYKWMITKMLTREIGITFFVTIKEEEPETEISCT
jgi:hypothetical protein